MGGKDQPGAASDDTARPRDQQTEGEDAQPGKHHQTLADVDTPTMRTLWQRIASCMGDVDLMRASSTCKVFAQDFRAAIKNLDVSQPLSQTQLERMCQVFPNVHDITISLEYDDNLPLLDFTVVRLRLPQLRTLRLDCCPIRTLGFTTANTPLLESLSIDNQGCHAMEAFHLELPQLRALSFNYVQVDDPRGFGPSLAACPKLESMSCYKLWGLGGMVHDLDLPCCVDLDLYRSDDLDGFRLYAPRLTRLNLQACYGLECVRLLDDARPRAAAQSAAPGEGASAQGLTAEAVAQGRAPDDAAGQGRSPSPARMVVNLVNANIDPESKRHLKQHPRVRKLYLKTHDEDMGFGLMGYGIDELEDDDDMEEDEEDEEDEADMLVNNVAALMAMFGGVVPEQMAQAFNMLHAGGGGGGVEIHDEDEDEFEHEEEDEWETDEGDE